MPNSKKGAQLTNSTGPLILIAVGIVLILIVLILALFNAQTNGPQSTGLQPTIASDIPYPEIARISLDDARGAFDNQTALFIDVRSAESYDQKHIPGSVNYPLDQLESQVPQLDPNVLLIPYCT